MDSLLKEKLKDIIIDYLFDFSHNDKVRIIEGDGSKLTVSPGVKIEDDPVMNSLFEKIKNSGSVKMYYGNRDNETCELVSADGKTAHADLLKRLERLGIEKSDDLGTDIKEAIQFLCDRSYLKRDQPLDNKVGLTSKGIKHYESGKSFEDDYLKKDILVKSDRRSRNSKRIAIISLVVSGLIGISGLVMKYLEKSEKPITNKISTEVFNSITLDYLEKQIKEHGKNNIEAYFRPSINQTQLDRLTGLTSNDSINFSDSEKILIKKLADASGDNKEERKLIRLTSSKVNQTVDVSFSKFILDDKGQNGILLITQYFKNDSSRTIHGGWEQLNFYQLKDSTWTLRKEKQIVEF